MNTESKKYKIRLIILCIIYIISFLLGMLAVRQAKKVNTDVQNVLEALQSTPEEDSQEIINSIFNANNDQQITKEQAIKQLQEMNNLFESIFKYSDFTAILIFTFVLASPFSGIMMYLIFAKWALKEIWKDIKPWMSILISILILIILLQTLLYALIFIGMFGQIIFVIYTIYKYFKCKHTEDKDDVIKTK